MRSLIRNDVGAVPTAHEVLFRGRRVAHTKLRVGLALSLLAIWNSAAFAQMPPPTNPNLVRFGYYFVNEKNGDDTAYVWPYTNLYVAIPSNAAADGIDWQARLSEQLNAATVNHKAVYLILGECTEYVAVIPDPVTHQDCSQYYWDPILDVAQSYWGQVAYVEVAHEPYPGNMDTPEQMDTRISTLNTKLAARGLAARPLGAIFNTSQIQSTNAILAWGCPSSC